MVNAADAWDGDDLRGWRWSLLHRSRVRAVLVEGQVAPVLVIIAEVFRGQAADVGFVQDDNVVEQIGS